MTGIEIAAVITSVSSLVAAVGSAVGVVVSARNGRRIELVHLATNSMKDELVKVTGEQKYAEGLKHGEDNPREGRTP
jgi:hypothetical protein